jgi:PAS domain S-box-containing protein
MERRHFFLTIVLVFVLLSATAFHIGYRHHTITMEQTLKQDRSTANLLSLVLEERLKKLVSVMESYSNRRSLLQAVRDKNVKKASVHLINLTKSNPDIDNLFISDKQGTLWAVYPERPEALGKNFAYRDWYQDVSKEWKSIISDVVLRVVGEKDLAVQISVPFFDETGEAMAILVNTQRTIVLSNLIKQVPPDPDASITVTDRKGQIVYSSRYNVEQKIRLYPFYPVMKKALAAKHKTLAVYDHEFDGRTRYISFSPIVTIGWTVFVGRDKWNILWSESAYYIQVTTISFLLFLLIIFFLFYLRKQVRVQQRLVQLQAERELQASETRFRELFDNMSSGVAVYKAIDDGENFILSDLNEAGQRITQVYSNFMGKRVTDVFPGVKELGLFEVFQQVWKTGKLAYYPYSQYKDDLLTFWVENFVYKLTSNEIVAVFDDITDRMRAEEALKENERTKSELLEKLNEAQHIGMIGSWEWNLKTNDVWWSDETYRIFGVTPQDYIPSFEANGRFIHPDDFARYGKSFEHSLQTGEPLDYAFRLVTNEGLLKHCHAGGKCFHDDSGQPIRLIGTVMDITDRKRAEAEIHQLNAELEQRVIDRTAQLEAANKELEAFSYSVSHDLRAPLRSIDGFSQALLEEYQEKLDDTGKGYLERVRKATLRMGRLIDDLLKLSRINRAEIKNESIDLSGMARAIAEANQKSNPDRAIDVIIQEGIMVQGDPTLMQIVLVNLLDNAFKFTGKETHPRIEFGTAVMDGKIAYYVRDNGAGFDIAYAGKLFGAFQRLHTREEFSGTGIGLATVQRIINRHGGHIWGKGEVGKGATFYFTLPSQVMVS